MELLLEEGKTYTLKDLAEWFGSNNPKYLHRKAVKEKKLEELKLFANFIEDGKKIKILEVYEQKYIKQSKREKNDKFYQQAIIEVIDKAPLQYYKTAAGRIAQSHKTELAQMNHNSFETTYTYTRRNMKKMFVDEQTHGQVSDKKVWCKRFYNSEYDFMPISEQELKYWKDLLEKYLQDKEYIDEVAAVLSLQDAGELSSNEVRERTFSLLSMQWEKIKKEFAAKFGFVPVAVPKYELYAIVKKELQTK